MTLAECTPGDIVVVCERGAERYLLLGALLGPHPKRSRVSAKHVELALVHDVDAESLIENLRCVRSASPGLEVIALVASASFLRAMRLRWWQTTSTFRGDVELDPMMSTRVDQEAF